MTIVIEPWIAISVILILLGVNIWLGVCITELKERHKSVVDHYSTSLRWANEEHSRSVKQFSESMTKITLSLAERGDGNE